MAQQNDSLKVYSSGELSTFDDAEFQQAVSRILLHKQSTLKFQTSLTSASGVELSGDYSLGRISHNYFTDCVFNGASLRGVAGVGSIFDNVRFLQTDLSHATFQSSTFENCYFEESKLESSNLSECYICNVSWKNCLIDSTNMSSSLLKDCRFISTKPGSLAGATLDNVYLEDVRFTNINLEYATFKDFRAENVIFPFSQMPYIFGGLEYILSTKDSVRISSHINAADSITIDEYAEVLHDMEIFYSHQKEYFPLASILLAFHRYDEALAATLYGIKDSALRHDLRMCKYYCKLITENGRFPVETLHALYQELTASIPIQSLTEAQRYQYAKHMPEIRTMLVENPAGLPHAIITLETQIDSQNGDEISLFLTSLDMLLHLKGTTLNKPSISISHNSPITLVLNLCGTPIAILSVAVLVLNFISVACKAYNSLAQAVVTTQTIIKNNRDSELNKLEHRKLAAEVAKLEMENGQLMERVAQQQARITKSGIVIAKAGMTAQDFDVMKSLQL